MSTHTFSEVDEVDHHDVKKFLIARDINTENEHEDKLKVFSIVGSESLDLSFKRFYTLPTEQILKAMPFEYKSNLTRLTGVVIMAIAEGAIPPHSAVQRMLYDLNSFQFEVVLSKVKNDLVYDMLLEECTNHTLKLALIIMNTNRWTGYVDKLIRKCLYEKSYDSIELLRNKATSDMIKLFSASLYSGQDAEFMSAMRS